MSALHRQAALIGICSDFFKLLDGNPPEEQVHQFLNDHRVLLQPSFTAIRVWSKPPITSHYKADFAILTSARELLLVELERPGITLLKKDGGMSAELQKPFDQARNWLTAVTDHRAAILNDLKIPGDQVNAIQAVVVAGRDFGQNPAHLRNLKLNLARGDVRFMTYDDLLIAMIMLTESIADTEPLLRPSAAAKNAPRTT